MNMSGENDGYLLFRRSATRDSYPHHQTEITIALSAETLAP